MSGPIVAQRVITLSPGTAVVFMSGYTDEQLGEHGVLSEEVAFLQKPFRAGGLLTLVREQLDGRTVLNQPQQLAVKAARPRSYAVE
jgi:two-component system, cell cycle sensor histidine kinase and response regulator CckA